MKNQEYCFILSIKNLVGEYKLKKDVQVLFGTIFIRLYEERRISMERAMSVEERIRRAENIYNRRNGIYARNEPKAERTTKKAKKGSVKRLLMQMFICLLIYVVFYAVTNRNYIFSEEFRNDVGSFVNEKTKISDWYNSAKSYIQSEFEEESNTESEPNKEKKGEEQSNSTENKIHHVKKFADNI